MDEIVGRRNDGKSEVEKAVPSPTTDRAAKKARQIAIALQYEPERESAPRVVTTRKGAVAEQILAIAFANGVKVRQDAGPSGDTFGLGSGQHNPGGGACNCR